MTVLQYCPDSKQQAQFVETLMLYKKNVCLDLLAVVAYGPQPILNAAGQILLHYYPLAYAGNFFFVLKCSNYPETTYPDLIQGMADSQISQGMANS